MNVMIFFLAFSPLQAEVPPSAWRDVRKVVEMNRRFGCDLPESAFPSAFSVLSHANGWHELSAITADSKGKWTLSFTPTWKFALADFASRAGPTGSATKSQVEGYAVPVIRSLLDQGPSVDLEVMTLSDGRGLTVSARQRIGPLTWFPRSYARFDTGGLLKQIVVTRSQLSTANLNAPRLSKSVLSQIARNAYWNSAPLPYAEVYMDGIYFGVPPTREGETAPGAMQAADQASDRAMPFYAFTVARTEGDAGQWIFVDARDAAVWPIQDFSAGGMAGFGKVVARKPKGNRIAIGESSGLVGIPSVTTQPPKGLACPVTSGKSLWLGRLDGKGVVWLYMGEPGWCGYKLSGRLLTAARAEVSKRSKSK